MAVKGAVLGDILGSQYEFHRPKKLDWKNVPLVNTTAMGFTDDTVMMMAIAWLTWYVTATIQNFRFEKQEQEIDREDR